jgi:lipopolysaccharide export system permease protein
MTFDRYLLRSYLHVFSVSFVALFGLVVVVDLLENLDDFLARNSGGTTESLLRNIGRFYAFQSIFFLERSGSVLSLLAVIVVLILFQRSGELHPLLAAGVPMYRVLMPLVIAAGGVSGLLLLNQELVIPRIAYAAYDTRGGEEASEVRVEPIYDHASRISIDGRRLMLSERTIEQAEFVLPTPSIAGDLTILKAAKAIHKSAKRGQPAGWLLQDVSPRWPDLPLTEDGRKLVLPAKRPEDIYIVTAVTCDQLYKRNSSFTMLSSQELLRRIHSPAFGLVSVQRLVIHLHSRFVRPLLSVISVLIVLPLMVRRESRGLVVDCTASGVALGLMFGLAQGCVFLAQMRMVAPDLAAWLPVIGGGALAAWYSDVIRT